MNNSKLWYKIVMQIGRITALYKEVEGRGARYKVARAAYRSTDISIRSRSSASYGKSTTTATHAVALPDGHWVELLEPRSRFASSPSPIPLFLS
jgi:hypothetical protein